MFRKYTALAAAVMLASSVSVSLAESAAMTQFSRNAAPARQECCLTSMCCITTSEPLFSANPACNSTCGNAAPTNHYTFTTENQLSTFRRACVATCSPVSGEIPAVSPTAFPQATPSGKPAQRPSVTQSPSTGDDYTTQSVSAQEQKMVNLLNLDRKNNGLGALTLDAELCRIARIKSADMRDNSYFAHESPTYGRVGEMLKHFGYSFGGAGENIAHHANVDKAQAAFMSSAGHRANILSRTWTKVGVGIVADKDGFIYATQIFAR